MDKQLRAGDVGASIFRGQYTNRARQDSDAQLPTDDIVFAIDEISRIIVDRCPEATSWELDPDTNAIHVRFRAGEVVMEPDRLDSFDAPVRAAIQSIRRAHPLSA